MAHLNPTAEDVTPKVNALREAFKKHYADNIKNGLYDERDLERLASDDAYARCFLRSLKAKADPEKAADQVHDSFKFRKEIGLNDVNAEMFPAEMTDRHAIYYQGVDRQDHPILYINVKENVTKPEQYNLLKQYVAWHFELHQKVNPEQMCVVLMDMSGAGLGNVGIDITKFIITCFTTYFPSFLAYMINYDMPFLLSATWSMISTFLSNEQKQKLLVIKKSEIGKYIADDHLWPHMKKINK